MAWQPIAGVPPQIQASDGTLASGYYLKFYQKGTTTATNMATDDTGGTTLAKCQINASGYPINGSSAVFIPHIDQDYKLALYTNDTDADADTLGNADWVVDSIEFDSLLSDLQSTTTDDTTNGFHLVYYPPKTGEDTVVNYEYPYYTSKRYGCDSANTAAANTTIIESVLSAMSTDGGGVLEIEEDISWNRGSLVQPTDVVIIDRSNSEIIFANIALGNDSSLRSHVRVRPAPDDAIGQVWIMPNGEPDPTSNDQAGSVKVFHDDYAAGSDYRDGGWSAHYSKGTTGAGVLLLNSKCNGNHVPFRPDIGISFQGGQDIPLRACLIQPAVATAGNYFAGGAHYTFTDGYPIWKEGMTVTQGQLVHMYGRVYEAQSAGTTGSDAPDHGTYLQYDLTVSSLSGSYNVGEVVRDDSGANGVVESVSGSGPTWTIRIEDWNQTAWTNSDTITGDDSGATSTLDSNASVNVDVDNSDTSFRPPGTPVAGRTVSDGAINWRFLDDVKPNITGNNNFDPLIIIGDKDTDPKIGYAGYELHVATNMLVYEGQQINFQRDSNNNILLRREANNLVMEDTNGGQFQFQETGPVKLSSKILANDTYSKPDTDTTVDLDTALANVILFNDTSGTNFTGFSNATQGMIITMRFNTGNTTLVHSSNFLMPGSSNLTPAAGTAYQVVYHDGTIGTLIQ